MVVKRYFGVVALLLFFLLLSSCNRREKAIIKRAELFLEYYFKADFENLKELCSPQLGEDLVSSLKSIDTLDNEVKEMIVKQTSNIEYNIGEVEKRMVKDIVLVTYKVSLPGYPTDSYGYKLSLIKSEGEWRVASLGRR